MESFKAYLYATEAEALAAVDLVNQGEGIPNNGYLTQTYFIPLICNEGYYIIKDEVTSKYLSNLQTITINKPTP